MADFELIVVGGGPAGLAAALSAWNEGLRRILIIERENDPGGILNQCIHNGFGIHYFGKNLTGPEYAAAFIKDLLDTEIELLCDSMVLEITQDRIVSFVNQTMGYQRLSADSIILAMGCRERTRGAIGIPGTRPAGVLTAGTAQRYINIDGFMPGKRVVILGSGDIGLIMARRMTLEGAHVLACIELMPYPGGLARNIVQCLEDYDIPLYLSSAITEIRGENRVCGVTVMQVDAEKRPIPGTEIDIDCDTLLLSVGLIPENELSRNAGILLDDKTKGPIVYENRETSVPGIFACGNVLQVHDMVDFVTVESQIAGRAAAAFVRKPSLEEGVFLEVENGEGVSYVVPQKVRFSHIDEKIELYFRVQKPGRSNRILVTSNEKQLALLNRGHMTPGEMEIIRLSRETLKQAVGSLTLSVEEVAE